MSRADLINIDDNIDHNDDDSAATVVDVEGGRHRLRAYLPPEGDGDRYLIGALEAASRGQ